MDNIKLKVNGLDVVVQKTTFPAGESCIRIKDNSYPVETITIFFDFKSNNDLFDLALLVDAVRRFYGNKPIDLHMPYLPYARQDRVCNEGESLSVKVVADFINNLNFRSVTCVDVHSDVGKGMLNNLEHINQADAAWRMPFFCDPKTTALVSPDAGAEKKVFDFAKKLGYNSVIRASKVRNVATGKIEKTTLIDDVHENRKHYLIVDDICDGGRTFVELAKVLKDESGPEPKINLYVTHGIFSAGLDVFDGLIDNIYVHNLMNEGVRSDSRITVV